LVPWKASWVAMTTPTSSAMTEKITDAAMNQRTIQSL
jgi:hypothetical protein